MTSPFSFEKWVFTVHCSKNLKLGTMKQLDLATIHYPRGGGCWFPTRWSLFIIVWVSVMIIPSPSVSEKLFWSCRLILYFLMTLFCICFDHPNWETAMLSGGYQPQSQFSNGKKCVFSITIFRITKIWSAPGMIFPSITRRIEPIKHWTWWLRLPDLPRCS